MYIELFKIDQFCYFVNKICWHHDVIEILLKVALDTNRSYYFNEVIM